MIEEKLISNNNIILVSYWLDILLGKAKKLKKNKRMYALCEFKGRAGDEINWMMTT